MCVFFFFKQKTAYERRISDWSSDVCSSDLRRMKDMKAYLAGALLAAAVATVAGAPGAQAFPEREIEVIVNYGAGGGTDLSTRVLADAAAKILGQPLRIVNRAGGSGTVGPTFCAHAKPDGYHNRRDNFSPRPRAPNPTGVAH